MTDRLSAVHELPPDRMAEAVDVLCDAFGEYPVMRHVIGAISEDYAGRLRTLIEFFAAARVYRAEPMLAVTDQEHVVGVALLTPPGEREAPAALAEHRESVWNELGAAARDRYEALGRVWQGFAFPDAHYHLNMIGVRRSDAGSGVGRRLLDAVHDMSARDSASIGVTLTTEDPANVPLYQHFGYKVVGHVNVSENFDTWDLFRADHDPL